MTGTKKPAKRPKRFKRSFRGVGEIRRSSKTLSAKEHRLRDGILTKLHKNGRLDLLRDFKEKRVSIEELVDLDRRGTLLTDTVKDLVLRRPLWATVDEVLPKMGNKPSTRTRYHGALSRLQARKLLPALATVADVATAPWSTLRSQWPGGPSDWNHVGRSLSRLLTLVCGSKHHPLRIEFMAAFPFEQEEERVPDITVETFHRIVSHMEEWIQPAFYCLVITGMRLNEYLDCQPRHLMPDTRQIRIPGTKTEGSTSVLPIDPVLWPWVEAAIPCPIREQALRRHWHLACQAAGVRRHTIHDIRHLTGQWLANQGMSDATIATYLRHVSPASTRRYTRQQIRGQQAEAMASILVAGGRRLAGPKRVPFLKKLRSEAS